MALGNDQQNSGIVVAPAELQVLEQHLQQALRCQRQAAQLPILGYGEISTVVRWQFRSGVYACKRLPPFASAASWQHYRVCFAEYQQRLRSAGLAAVPSQLQVVPCASGAGLIAYCLQPVYPATSLLPRVFATQPRSTVQMLYARLWQHCQAVVTPQTGLDGQLSNWVYHEGQLGYLDLSTPLMRDEEGREILDADLFLAAAPWILRGLLKRWALQPILDKYYCLRGIILDLLGNLYKEGLTHLIGMLLEQTLPWVQPPLTLAEIQRYYRQDAQFWTFWQMIRRLDRWWQRRIRGRVYPFLLPTKIRR